MTDKVTYWAGQLKTDQRQNATLGALSLHFAIISAMYLLECLRLLGTSFPKNIFTLSSLLVAFGGFGISPYTRQLSARTAAKSHLYWEEVTTVRLVQVYLRVRLFSFPFWYFEFLCHNNKAHFLLQAFSGLLTNRTARCKVEREQLVPSNFLHSAFPAMRGPTLLLQ